MELLLLAILLGGAFGFTLDRVGATNPDDIIGMLRLSRLRLMKTIFLAIGVASAGLFAGILAGLIDVGHLSVKTSYLGVVIGGMLLGAGFAVAGYCPGTGLTAAATGRWDAFAFILGGFVGAAGYMVTYEWLAASGVLSSVFGGKVTLGTIAGTSYPALFPELAGEIVGLVVAAVLIVVAALLPARILGSSRDAAAAQSNHSVQQS
ncbi:MAG: YeeE/YedE thiosulfate transporter family protein [Pseudomonadota bacterium]